MDSEKPEVSNGAHEEKTEIKMNAALKEETLHDSALRGHLATDRYAFSC
jgi:hypothetical protein